MSQNLVLCDHAQVPAELSGQDVKVVNINENSPNRNLRLEIKNISHALLRNLNDLGNDLLHIAAYVYHADSSISRGTIKDVFEQNWSRDFIFVIPVRRPDVWNREEVKIQLIEVLEYLTEDRFEFHFVQRQSRPEQLAIKGVSEALPYSQNADSVLLYSGGLDSLGGVVDLYYSGRKPVLVSHRSRPTIVRLQQTLAEAIRGEFSGWDFPHLDIWINRKGDRAKETSQRSRSFLFFAIGTLVAQELGIERLFVCENGITTFNLPRLGQPTGASASRSTHPLVISIFESLVNLVFERLDCTRIGGQ